MYLNAFWAGIFLVSYSETKKTKGKSAVSLVVSLRPCIVFGEFNVINLTLCPLKQVTSTPCRDRVTRRKETRNWCDNGIPDSSTKRGPGFDGRTAR